MRGAELIVKIAPQDAVFDQHCSLRSIALVIDIDGATCAGDGPIIGDGDLVGGDALGEGVAGGSCGCAAAKVLQNGELCMVSHTVAGVKGVIVLVSLLKSEYDR